MNQLPSYIKVLPDGRVSDIRLKYRPGTRVRITDGPFKGQVAVIDRLIGMVQKDGYWIPEPGYNARLDDNHYVTIQWDLAEPVE